MLNQSLSAVTLQLFCSLGAVIGFSEVSYTVFENENFVRLCAEIKSGNIARDTIVTLRTSDQTARGQKSLHSYVRMCALYVCMYV